jgi:hypothetical protein
MKTNTLLVVAVVVLVGIVLYLLLNTPTRTTVSREYVPVVYEDSRPRETILVGGWGGWGGWGFPTKPWGGHPPPPPPPPGGGAPPPPPPGDAPPPPAPPPPPPAESPATFVDMSKNVEGFFSPSSYPFA